MIDLTAAWAQLGSGLKPTKTNGPNPPINLRSPTQGLAWFLLRIDWPLVKTEFGFIMRLIAVIAIQITRCILPLTLFNNYPIGIASLTDLCRINIYQTRAGPLHV